ncbi:MAG TPA: flagellar hook-associated protein FlgL [Burkholderiaceae bacterium]|nr:flagellar hook-associated protein FlgL [Burkholderiaceae bacterium]
MHIATANAYNISLDQLMTRQQNLANAQEQLTSGKRVNRASDDPAAAARAERALAAEARSTAIQRAVDASDNAMTLSESALGDAGELLQQIREKLVQAGNTSLADADRKSIAAEVSEMRKQLFSIANRTDGAGTYLFGGQSADQPPFIDAIGGVQFTGQAGAQQAASGEPLPLTVDGDTAWMRAGSGNGVFATRAVTSTGSARIDGGSVTNPQALTGDTYTVTFSVSGGSTTYTVLQNGSPTTPPQSNIAFSPGQSVQVDGMSAAISGNPANGDVFELAPSTPVSVFDAVDQAIADLNAPNRTNTQNAQAASTNLTTIDSVMGQLQSARSQVGATLNRADGVTDRLSALKLASQTERSNAESLDMTQAISDFGNQQTGYDAALKTYSMVQKLSLFNYLG